MTHFRHCETFSKFFLGLPRHGLFLTGAVNFFTCGYCFDLMQCENILRQCIKLGFSLVMYEDRVQFQNVLR